MQFLNIKDAVAFDSECNYVKEWCYASGVYI